MSLEMLGGEMNVITMIGARANCLRARKRSSRDASSLRLELSEFHQMKLRKGIEKQSTAIFT